MENLPRNPQRNLRASHTLDDLLNLLVDLDVASHPGAAKSNSPDPITNHNSTNGDRLSTPDLSHDPIHDPSYDPNNGNNSSSKVSNLITAHRQSLLKSLSLPISPLQNSPPEKPSIPPHHNPASNLVTPPPKKTLPEEVKPETSHPETSHIGISNNGINHHLRVDQVIDSELIVDGRNNNRKSLPEVDSKNSHPSYSEISHGAIDRSFRINDIDNPKVNNPEVNNPEVKPVIIPEINGLNISETSYSQLKVNNPEVNDPEVRPIIIPKTNELNIPETSYSQPKVNNPEINNPEVKPVIIPEIINGLNISETSYSQPKVNNSEVNNSEVKPVIIPETNDLNMPETSYSQISDFIHPKVDHFEVNHSKPDNSTNSRNSDSENSSRSSFQNDSRNSYSQVLHPASNEAKATINSLGLLMDLALNSEDPSSPIRQTVEVTAIPVTIPEPPLALVVEPVQELEEDEEDEDPLNILQRLLVNPDVYDSQKLLQRLEVSLKKLESQIYEPEKLIELLLPTIAELLSLKISQSKTEVVDAITPIIDEVIQHRIKQDHVAMSAAIAPIISEAISKQIVDSPEAISNAIGPTMGKAIQEQVRLEKDSMVDALYPIIGTTISKYMAEAIADINRQVEGAFSLKGFQRKIQSKIQGVSEAELILREALPFTVSAAFLVHKNSGLLIADAQPPQEEQLEADMIAGMLTAIRSFANDCMTSSSKNSSELNQIDYSGSKIVLEVAGYCYLALVVKGQMTESFVKKFRRSMATIVRIYNKPIMNFEGDRSTIPVEVNTLIEDLIINHKPDENSSSKYPFTLGLVILGAVSIIAIPLGIYQYRQSIDNQIAAQVTTALDRAPELSVYRLEAQVIDDKVRLIGKVPNSGLQKKAETIAHQVETKLAIDNQIIAVDIPIDPNFTVAEIRRNTMILNTIPGVLISPKYQQGVLEISGIARDRQSVNNITKVMQNIPGIKVLSNQIQLRNISQEGILRRIYFEAGSVTLPSSSLSQITEIKDLLILIPNFRLRIIGYADNIGDSLDNKGLATARAISVQQILLEQGIEQERLEIRGSIRQVPEASELWQSRFVEFELIAPNI